MWANQTKSGITVEIEGLDKLRSELRELDPELVKLMDKIVREYDKTLISKVNESFPTGTEEQFLSGWLHNGRTGYNKAAVDKGTRVTQGKRKRGSEFKVLKQISQATAAGTMFDRVGRKGSPKVEPWGELFIDALKDNFGGFNYRYGTRALWRGFSLWGGYEKYNDTIINEYEKAVQAFENRVNTNG